MFTDLANSRSYFVLFAKRFGYELYRSWRAYMFSTIAIALIVFTLSKGGDASSTGTAFILTLKATGIFLVLFAVYHLFRTPWLLHKDASRSQNDITAQLTKTSEALKRKEVEYGEALGRIAAAEKRIGDLEDALRERAQKPNGLIRFAYENNCALIYVKNIGTIGDFFSTLRIGLPMDDVDDLHARWAHTNDTRTKIPSGMERKLLLAKLNYTHGGFTTSQWEIFFARDGVGIGSVRPACSSVVGHPDAQASDVWLEVIVVSDPDMDGGIKSRRIILHSNRAEEAP
jgi:hypothetical protein